MQFSISHSTLVNVYLDLVVFTRIAGKYQQIDVYIYQCAQCTITNKKLLYQLNLIMLDSTPPKALTY